MNKTNQPHKMPHPLPRSVTPSYPIRTLVFIIIFFKGSLPPCCRFCSPRLHPSSLPASGGNLPAMAQLVPSKEVVKQAASHRPTLAPCLQVDPGSLNYHHWPPAAANWPCFKSLAGEFGCRGRDRVKELVPRAQVGLGPSAGLPGTHLSSPRWRRPSPSQGIPLRALAVTSD